MLPAWRADFSTYGFVKSFCMRKITHSRPSGELCNLSIWCMGIPRTLPDRFSHLQWLHHRSTGIGIKRNFFDLHYSNREISPSTIKSLDESSVETAALCWARSNQLSLNLGMSLDLSLSASGQAERCSVVSTNRTYEIHVRSVWVSWVFFSRALCPVVTCMSLFSQVLLVKLSANQRRELFFEPRDIEDDVFCP